MLPGRPGRLASAFTGVDLILSKSEFAGLALDEGIGEALDVTGSLPDSRVHQDRGIDTFHVLALVNHPAPPALLHISFELDSQRSVVPDGPGPSIDLGGLEDEAAPLAQRHELVHHIMLGHGFAKGREVRDIAEAETENGPRGPLGVRDPTRAE